jgi:hypothetical protein
VLAVLRTLNSTASVNLLRYLPMACKLMGPDPENSHTNEGPLCLPLPSKLFGSHVALLELASSVTDSKGADVAVTVEPLKPSCQLTRFHVINIAF